MAFDYEAAKLDLSLPKAIYVQLTEAILKQIEIEALKPGDLLPSEAELCQQYNISRTTVRLSLRELEKNGLLLRRQGLGTFVAQPKLPRRLDTLYSFTTDMEELGLKPTSRIVSFRQIDSEECPRANGEFQPGRWLEVVRLRLADGKPLLLEQTYLPVRLCPNLSWEMLENGSLYQILTEYGIRPCHALETYEAILMSKKDGTQLGCPVGAPAFRIHRSTWDTEEQLVEYTESVMPGAYSKFEVSLYQGGAQINRRTM